MVAAVFFDFDGTLVDSNAFKRQGYFDVVASHANGARRMQRVLEKTVGDRREVFAAYLRETGEFDAAACEQLVRSYGTHVDDRVIASVEMPGASELLSQLRASGVRSFLSSATPLSSLTRIVERRGWSDWFEQIFGSPADKKTTLRQVRERHGFDAAAVCVVGDGVDDRESAAANGCRFFPVGEARGRQPGEPVFTLVELRDVLLSK